MLPNLPETSNPNIGKRKQDEQFFQLLSKWVGELLQTEKKESDIQKALISIFQRLFQVLFDLNNHTDVIKESMNSLIFTSNTLYNIRFYLRQNLPSSIPLGKVFNKHGRKYTFIEMEGFDSNSSSDDENQTQKDFSKMNPHTKQHIKDQETIEDLNFKARVLQGRIKELEGKLTIREQTIEEMTSGYLKDLYHLREMYTRKQDDPDLFVYEVNYYDAQTNFDPEVKSFIEFQIKNALEKAKEKIAQVNDLLKIQQQENQQLKKSIEILVSKHDLQQVVQTLFLMESDKYKIWKVIQDYVGNEEIFSLFENQKDGYGIDYREINELIGKSQASWREYEIQRDLMNNQLDTLIRSSRQEIKRLNEVLKEKENQLHSLHQQLEYDTVQAKRETKILMENHFKEREQSIFKQFQRVKDQVLTKWIKTDIQDLVYKTMTKSALIKWRHYSLFLKIYPLMQQYKVSKTVMSLTELDYCSFDVVRQHLLKQLTKKHASAIEQKPNKTDIEIMEDLRQEINFQQEQNAEITLERDSLIKHCKDLEVKIQKYKNDLSMLQHSYNVSKHRQRQMENTFNLLEKPYYYILKRLGFQELQIKIGTLNKIGKTVTGLDMESFLTKLTELTISKEDLVRMCHSEFIKSQFAFDIMASTSDKMDVSTITDISDINYTMQHVNNLLQEGSIKHGQLNKNKKDRPSSSENESKSEEEIKDKQFQKQKQSNRLKLDTTQKNETLKKPQEQLKKQSEPSKKPEIKNSLKKQNKKPTSPKNVSQNQISLPVQIPKERIKQETPQKNEVPSKQQSLSPSQQEINSLYSNSRPTSRQVSPQKIVEVKQKLDQKIKPIQKKTLATQTLKIISKSVAVQTFGKEKKPQEYMKDASVQVEFFQSAQGVSKALFSVGVQAGSQIGLCHLTQINSNDQQFSLSVHLREPDMNDVYQMPVESSKHFLSEISNRKNDYGSKKRTGGQSVRLTTLITQKNIQKLGQSLEPLPISPIESKGHNIQPRISFQQQVQKKPLFVINPDSSKPIDHYQTLFNQHKKKIAAQPKDLSVLEFPQKVYQSTNLPFKPYNSLAPDFIFENA